MPVQCLSAVMADQGNLHCNVMLVAQPIQGQSANAIFFVEIHKCLFMSKILQIQNTSLATFQCNFINRAEYSQMLTSQREIKKMYLQLVEGEVEKPGKEKV